jgi:hypothetical protein
MQDWNGILEEVGEVNRKKQMVRLLVEFSAAVALLRGKKLNLRRCYFK